MPLPKQKHQLIDFELSEKCKRLFTTEDRIKISKKFGFSPAYVNMIIRRERGANAKVKKALEVTATRIQKKLS